MASQRTEKSCFESRFGGGWISSAQWLAENMCDREARANFGGGLPQKFWNDDFWAKKLKLQIKHANDLLKDYTVDMIVSALKHPSAKKVYSLGLKTVLVPLMNIEKKNKEHTEINKTETYEVNTAERPRAPFSNKASMFNRLKEIDNG